MTTPKAAISEERHGLYGAGRLYGVEGFDTSVLTCAADTREALRENLLMPSVTNVIGLYPKDHLQGWYGREAAKTLGAAHAAVDARRSELLTSLVTSGVNSSVIVRAARSDIPPVTALERHNMGVLILDDLALEAQNWIVATQYALSNACSVREFEMIVRGTSSAPVKRGFNTFFGQMKKGVISPTEHDVLTSVRRDEVVAVLRSLPDANWLYSSLSTAPSGVGLLGLAAERSRDKSSVYGNEVHDLVEQLTFDPDFPHSGEYQFHVDAWRAWVSEFNPTDMFPELSVLGVTDDGLPYGGTADLFAKINDVGAVIDYKTSKTLSESTVTLQMAALAHADTVPFQVDLAVALHLPRQYDADRLLKYKPKNDDSYDQYARGFRAFTLDSVAIDDGWAVFSAARKLWQELYVHGSKKSL
jgi:hypothetical protein